MTWQDTVRTVSKNDTGLISSWIGVSYKLKCEQYAWDDLLLPVEDLKRMLSSLNYIVGY